MAREKKRFQIRNIKFRDRMLLIYIIGGIIPFIGASVFLNDMVTRTMIEISESSRQNELMLLAADVRKGMTEAELISDKISEDKTLLTLLQGNYQGKHNSEKKLLKQLQYITEYSTVYQGTIEHLSIHVKDADLLDESLFSPMTSSITKSSWYLETCKLQGEPYWSCGPALKENREDDSNCLQLSQVLYEEDGKVLGLLVVQLSNKEWMELMRQQSGKLGLLHNDYAIVFKNYHENDFGFLYSQLLKYPEKRGQFVFNRDVIEYRVSYERIRSENNQGYFTLVSIQNYQKLRGKLNRIMLFGVSLVGGGIGVSLLLIFIFSNNLSSRLKKLRWQMHLVANGQYDKVQPIEGEDEIGEIYSELEQMIRDIQALTSDMVDEKVQKEKLHTHQKEVEFKMLASQINPHFLYNTLETIRMKAMVNKQDEIEELVKMLAKIMRRNIQVSHQMVTLRSEIELIENYLKIQNYRFGDRIISKVVVDDDIDLDMEVMPLIMQPFVENAYAHGLESMTEDGRLEIRIWQDEVDVFIEIKDNGAGMPYYVLAELKYTLSKGENLDQTHIGVNNVNQRLKIRYGEDYGIQITSKENEGTSVLFRIPRNG